MRKLAILPFLMLIWSCTGDVPVQPQEDLVALASSHGATQMVPFKGKGDWWVTGVALGCEGAAENVAASADGVAELTHLGATEFSFVNCWDPPTWVSQTGTFFAANGDELYWYGATDMGSVMSFPTGSSYEVGPIWFTGGTGRFEGATGEFRHWGDVAADQASGTIRFEGMIISVGAAKH